MQFVAEMVKDLKPLCPWIYRHSIIFAWTKDRKNQVDTQIENPSTSTRTPDDIKPVGRPSSSTNDAKNDLK